MEISTRRSTLEMLPDEILLQICKYLLCNDILYSFSELNYRMTQMITEYRHDVSFHKTSLTKFNYLCVNILPQIGSQIRSLVIDRCYSVLQGDLFIKYFGNKMSIIFPKLERISLVSYEQDILLVLLNTLHDMNHLNEIRLYGLFEIEKPYQPIVTEALFKANNHQITTILMDYRCESLSLCNTDCYLNILQLTISVKLFADLFSLFANFPNVHYLDVTITGMDTVAMFKDLDKTKVSPLLQLTNFQLKSTTRCWKLEQLSILFVQLPILRNLSLFLFTVDRRLVDGATLLSLLPDTVQHFNYGISFFSKNTIDQDDAIITSWPPSQPVACYFNSEFLFIHTLPWHFTYMKVSPSIGKIVSCHTNNTLGYDRRMEQLEFTIDKKFTFSKSLGIISQCRRVREITINMKDDAEAIEKEQLTLFDHPKLPRLTELYLSGSILCDLNYFSTIVNAAPNLFSLDVPFEILCGLIEDPQLCYLLGQRITSLFILENASNSALLRITKAHIPVIASIFSRVCVLFVNLMHLDSDTKKASNEDLTLESLSIQKYKDISPFSSESMLIFLLEKFKEHRLISLCIAGQFLPEIKTDPEQWLRVNTILREQQFKALFDNRMSRLMIWM